MARTHGATQNAQPTSRFHQDDGVLLGKGGEPIPTSPVRGVSALNPHGQPIEAVPPAEIAPPSQAITAYQFICDKTTWQRNMDGWQALHLINAMLKQMLGVELSMTLSETDARRLPSDTRWHMRRVAVPIDAENFEEISMLDRIVALEGGIPSVHDSGPMTDEDLFDADPDTLSRGDKIRRGKLMARLEREKSE